MGSTVDERLRERVRRGAKKEGEKHMTVQLAFTSELSFVLVRRALRRNQLGELSFFRDILTLRML